MGHSGNGLLDFWDNRYVHTYLLIWMLIRIRNYTVSGIIFHLVLSACCPSEGEFICIKK